MTTALSQRPISPRTRQQQQSRLWSLVVLLVFLGPLTIVVGALLCGLARAINKPRAFAWLALAGVVGLSLLIWQWRALAAELLLLRDALRPLGGMLRPTPNQPVQLDQISQAFTQGWPLVWLLWRQTLLLAPMVASYIHTSRVKTAEELERDRAARQERAAQAAIQKAAARSASAPAAAGGELVLGVPIGGDLAWVHGGWLTYPAAILARHLVLIGGSGSGKTETCKRLASGAAQVYGWRVFYLDCKGDDETADHFMAAMRAAGCTTLARFPNDAYDGWRGDTTALLNRLMMILDFSEPYYRDLTRMLISLAVDAPPGPPRSSGEFLTRLNLDELARRYAGMPEARELAGIRITDAQAVYNRYRAFFKAVRGGLDGGWAFEDVQAGYIQLRGLDLRDQTASLGRYILEDFAHFVAARKPSDDRVLLIVDEFPAIAFGGANAASLFEMVRFHGAALIVTAQSYAGMGADADRILGAAAGLILHQCADPERLLARAGQNLAFERRITFTERGMGQAVKEYAVGEGMLAETAALKVDPNAIKQLGAGECVMIAGGRAQHVVVSRVVLPNTVEYLAPTPKWPTEMLSIAEIERVRRREQHTLVNGTSAIEVSMVQDASSTSTTNTTTPANAPESPDAAIREF
jgi:hypothetical protein